MSDTTPKPAAHAQKSELEKFRLFFEYDTTPAELKASAKK